MKNILIVISGPSGVGKGTITKKLIERNKDLSLSVSCTTRLPRFNEQNGREYFFISKEDFTNRIMNNGFLEYSEHFEQFYGTPKSFVLEKLKTSSVILEIDVNGALKVKENFKDAILIMIEPPSLEVLKARLIGRNTETEEKINHRLERIEFELGMRDKYDYRVINDDLISAVEEIEEIINKEKLS